MNGDKEEWANGHMECCAWMIHDINQDMCALSGWDVAGMWMELQVVDITKQIYEKGMPVAVTDRQY